MADGLSEVAETSAAEEAMAVTLLYHDVVPHGHDDASGLPGPGAARYKLTPDQFSAQVKADIERWGKVIKEAGIKAE